MSGKFIVIEGLDGSGKETQVKWLVNRLEAEGRQAMTITFPDYNSDAAIPVKMYLNGEFGSDAFSVNPYIASTFYAVDRAASYLKNWRERLDAGTTVIADRYTTSNMIHQGCKLEGFLRDEYLDWLVDFEYKRLMLPMPDIVIYLDMHPETSQELRQNREQKFRGTDIHESNSTYLEKCYDTAKYVAQRAGWKVIDCIRDDALRSIEDIHNEIYDFISGSVEYS